MALTKTDLNEAIEKQDKRFDQKLENFRKTLFIQLSEFLEEKLAIIPDLQRDVSKIKKDVSKLKKDMREVKYELEQINSKIDAIYERGDRHAEKLEDHEKRLTRLETATAI